MVAIIQVMQLPPVTKARKFNLDLYYKVNKSILDHLWCKSDQYWLKFKTHFYKFYIPEKIITITNYDFISWEINFYGAIISQINNFKNDIINKWAYFNPLIYKIIWYPKIKLDLKEM